MNLNEQLTPYIEESSFLKLEEKHNLLSHLKDFDDEEKKVMLKTFQEEQQELKEIMKGYKQEEEKVIKDLSGDIISMSKRDTIDKVKKEENKSNENPDFLLDNI